MQAIDKHPINSSILAGFLSPSCLGLVKNVPYLGCLKGAWKVSGRCLGVSCTLRIVSGAYRCQINCNKSCGVDQLSVIHFLPVAYFGLGRAAVHWVD